jgi:hypothetical protein
MNIEANLYSSSNVIREIESRRKRWAGYVAHMGQMRYITTFLSENLEERGHQEDLGVE